MLCVPLVCLCLCLLDCVFDGLSICALVRVVCVCLSVGVCMYACATGWLCGCACFLFDVCVM